MVRNAPPKVDGAHILTSVVEVAHYLDGEHSGEHRRPLHRVVAEVCITLQYIQGSREVFYHVSLDDFSTFSARKGSFWMDHDLGAPYHEARAIWEAWETVDNEQTEPPVKPEQDKFVLEPEF